MRIKERFDFKLLVEGNDDQHVVWNLCEYHQLAQSFDVIDCESVENAIRQFKLRVGPQASSNRRVGIVVDADVHLAARWESIRHILTKTGNYPSLPSNLPADGLIIEPGDTEMAPTVGVWMMPDNQLDGMLEDFLMQLADETVIAEVDSVLLQIEQKGIQRYKPVHKAKARIHTLLAWQETPGTPMGLAITKKYLDPTSEACVPFVAWMRKLFATEGDLP